MYTGISEDLVEVEEKSLKNLEKHELFTYIFMIPLIR